jgi:hypothetical protein
MEVAMTERGWERFGERLAVVVVVSLFVFMAWGILK